MYIIGLQLRKPMDVSIQQNVWVFNSSQIKSRSFNGGREKNSADTAATEYINMSN